MTKSTIGICGASGALGGDVYRRLVKRGEPVVPIIRGAREMLPTRPGPIIRLRDYADPDASRLLEGIDVLYMIGAHEAPDRLAHHKAFLASAKAAGVKHVVYGSYVGANAKVHQPLARDHYFTEKFLRSTGMGWTILRSNIYSEIVEACAGPTRVLQGPGRDGRVSVISRVDVARCAVSVLANPSAHLGAVYTLTGPEALTLTQLAEILEATRGHEFSYIDESVEDTLARGERFGLSYWQCRAFVSLYEAIAEGDLSAVTSDVVDLTGVAPTPLRQVLLSDRFSDPGDERPVPGPDSQFSQRSWSSSTRSYPAYYSVPPEADSAGLADGSEVAKVHHIR